MNLYQFLRLCSVSKAIGYEYNCKTVFSLNIPYGVKITVVVINDLNNWFLEKNHLVLPDTLLELTMGHYFSHPIVLPESLVRLKMGFSFDNHLLLPNNLLHLEFGDHFNKPIELPNTLIFLRINKNYNRSIVLPNSLLYLQIASKLNCLKTFPKKLRVLECYICKITPELILPSTLETIIFQDENVSETHHLQALKFLDNLSNSITSIVFKYYVHPHEFVNIPNSIKYIVANKTLYYMKNSKSYSEYPWLNIQIVKKDDDIVCISGEDVIFKIMPGFGKFIVPE